VDERQISRILSGLGSGDKQQAWTDFLDCYSPVIFQVVRLFEVDADHVTDCFLFVCQQLSQREFQRLRRFKLDGPASFSTWLRAVVRNLCLDWRRRAFGRVRVFESIARLGVVDGEVLRAVYQDGMSPEDALLTLRPGFPDLTAQEVADSCQRIQGALSPRQLWLLGTQRPRFEPLDAVESRERGSLVAGIRDPAPDPETLAARRQEQAAVRGALARLPTADRVL